MKLCTLPNGGAFDTIRKHKSCEMTHFSQMGGGGEFEYPESINHMVLVLISWCVCFIFEFRGYRLDFGKWG